LPNLKAIAGDLPLLVSVDFASFQTALEKNRLTGGVFYKVQGVPSVDLANRLMEKVRAYST
jgi:hypothetical protein